MNDPPIHPGTGKPVTPQQLVAESDALDRKLAEGDYAGLMTQVVGLRKLNERLASLVKLLAVVAVIAIATAGFSLYWAYRVDRNSKEIDQTQRAIQVYCEQTNIDRAEARDKFIAKFRPQTPANQQQQLADFVEVLFPQHDCTNVVEATKTTPPK